MQNMSVISVRLFNLDKKLKNVVLQHEFERFLFNIAHGIWLVPESIATGEKMSALKFSFSPSLLPPLLNFGLECQKFDFWHDVLPYFTHSIFTYFY